jgi:hypothetical protein
LYFNNLKSLSTYGSIEKNVTFAKVGCGWGGPCSWIPPL